MSSRLVSPWLAASLLWCAVVACIDTPVPEDPPIARIIVAWDPLACGTPHRIVVELEDDDGLMLATSTPCVTGSATLDARHFGVYHGRIYAWVAGEPIRSVSPVRLAVDQAVVRWFVATPP